MNTFTLIMKDSSRIKVPYSILPGTNKEMVTNHFSREELDTGHDDNAMFFKPTLDIIEKARIEINRPIKGNSGYRSRLKQEVIYNNYLAECKSKGVKPVPGKVAKPGNSPHETGAAVDLSIPKGFEPEQFAKLLQKISVDLGFPMARVGWKDYLGENFVHVDAVFLLYKPYTDIPNPFPTLWVPAMTW